MTAPLPSWLDEFFVRTSAEAVGEFEVDLTATDQTLSDEDGANGIIKVIGTFTSGTRTLFSPAPTAAAGAYYRVIRNVSDIDALIDIVGGSSPVTVNGGSVGIVGFDVDGVFTIK